MVFVFGSIISRDNNPHPISNTDSKSNDQIKYGRELLQRRPKIFDLKTPYNHDIRGIVELLKDIGQKNRKGKTQRAGKMGPSMRSTR